MKQDYIVRWSEMARFQLLGKAEYIYAKVKMKQFQIDLLLKWKC